MIFHHSLSPDVSAAEIRRWHIARGWKDIGYHAVIHPDGRIEDGRDIDEIGAHAYGRNRDSIGVCLIGNFCEDEPTLEAIQAAQSFFHNVCWRYMKRLKVEFHRWKIDLLHLQCPGPLLDRKDFLEIMYRGCPY